MDADRREELLILGRPASPILTVLVWGGGTTGVLIPLLVGTLMPRLSCDPFLERFPSRWPTGFLYNYAWVPVIIGIVVTLFSLAVLIDSISTHRVWIALVNFIGSIIMAGMGFITSWAMFYPHFLAPVVQDTQIVDGTEYVLATCVAADFEGGAVEIYRCNGEQRACHTVAHSSYPIGSEPPSTMRYEDGNLIVEGELVHGPLIYSLEDED